MKTIILIIIAGFLVLIPWIGGLEFRTNNQVMVNGITTSAIAVMIITIIFSMVSWLLFSWASKSIKPAGISLSIISAACLIIPFLQVLGPMTGVIIGVVAGFTSFMIQKKMTDPRDNRSLVVAAITLVAVYSVLIAIILVSQTTSMWDTGDGIGAWTGTVEALEEPGFYTILHNHIGFVFFLAIIPSLIITGLIIRGETK